MKKHIMWCIKHPTQGLMHYYGVHATRKECLKAFECATLDWRWWYRKGYRLVKVVVSELNATTCDKEEVTV